MLTISKDILLDIAHVRLFLEAQEVENGLFLGNLALHEQNPSLAAVIMALATVHGKLVFAAYYREINLILSRGSKDLVVSLAQKLLDEKIDIPGVVGPSHESETLAIEWARIRGCKYFLSTDQMIYKLTKVCWPVGIPGHWRLMESHDIPLMTQWVHDFHREALPLETFSVEQAQRNVEKRVPAQMTYLWVVDGKPVAMAALTRPTLRGIAVNAVYTPPEHRKKGYATALVAAVSAEGLNRGKEFCTLYTDLMNPTSNSIYQKIGYEPVCGSRNYKFRYEF